MNQYFQDWEDEDKIPIISDDDLERLFERHNVSRKSLLLEEMELNLNDAARMILERVRLIKDHPKLPLRSRIKTHRANASQHIDDKQADMNKAAHEDSDMIGPSEALISHNQWDAETNHPIAAGKTNQDCRICSQDEHNHGRKRSESV